VKTVTTHQAKTHLSRLLKEAQAGETIVILSGTVPAAKLVGTKPAGKLRPSVGTVTSRQVTWSDDAFRPLTEDELKAWGL
jgi:antitoxin (DNA-binding transcriptional repressor) of toxin-antitoxin stability system